MDLKPQPRIDNFTERLPAPQSDLARETLKDPYIFDFLSVGEEAHERELETALIVAELDSLKTEIDRLESIQTQTTAELDAMLPSILDQAFKGEL